MQRGLVCAWLRKLFNCEKKEKSDWPSNSSNSSSSHFERTDSVRKVQRRPRNRHGQNNSSSDATFCSLTGAEQALSVPNVSRNADFSHYDNVWISSGSLIVSTAYFYNEDRSICSISFHINQQFLHCYVF